jgi:hypothetical protein
MSKVNFLKLIEEIFDRPYPLPPYSLEITFKGPTNMELFKDISKIFMMGINHKYGENNTINIDYLTSQRMNIIKDFMHSFGITFNIKYVTYQKYLKIKTPIDKKKNIKDYYLNVHINPESTIMINFDIYIEPTVWRPLM